MTVTEFLIIYVSCGAPFAVERLLSGVRSSPPWNAVISALYLALWPVLVLVKLIRVIRSHFVSHKNAACSNTSNSSALDTRCKYRELAVLLQDAGVEHSIRQIIELLERYQGLAALSIVSSNGSSNYDFELAHITNHPSPSIAAACHNRRNALTINRHFLAARNEFLEMLWKATANSKSKEPFVKLAMEFAEKFDPCATGHFERLRTRSDDTLSARINSATPVRFEETIVSP